MPFMFMEASQNRGPRYLGFRVLGFWVLGLERIASQKWGLYGDKGKENGDYYNGLYEVQALGSGLNINTKKELSLLSGPPKRHP